MPKNSMENQLSLLRVSKNEGLNSLPIKLPNGEIYIAKKTWEEAVRFCITLDQVNGIYKEFLNRYFPDRPD